MLSDDECILREQVARAVEWALESPSDLRPLRDDLYFVPEAALLILADMDTRYPGLSEWAEAARSSIVAHTAWQVAISAGSSRALLIEFQLAANTAREKVEKLPAVNADDPLQVRKTYAKLQHMAAK